MRSDDRPCRPHPPRCGVPTQGRDRHAKGTRQSEHELILEIGCVRTLVHKGVAGEDCGGAPSRSRCRRADREEPLRTRTGRRPYSCNQCSQRFPGIEVLERHRELNHAFDSQGSGSEDLLIGEVQMAAGGGRGRRDWWRKVEPFLTPDIVLLAAALGLAYGLAALGTSFDVIVAFFSFGGTAVFIYVLRAWPAPTSHTEAARPHQAVGHRAIIGISTLYYP